MNARTPVILLGAVMFLTAFNSPAVETIEPTDEPATPAVPKRDPFLERLKAAMAPKLSPTLAGVEKLAKGGMSEDVVVGYIENSSSRFAPSADDLLRLREAGVSDRAVLALLQHDQKLPEAPLQPVQAPPVVQTVAAVQPIQAVPAPQVVQVVQQPVMAAPVIVTIPSVAYVEPEPCYFQQSPNVIYVPTSYSGSWSRRLSSYSIGFRTPIISYSQSFSRGGYRSPSFGRRYR